MLCFIWFIIALVLIGITALSVYFVMQCLQADPENKLEAANKGSSDIEKADAKSAAKKDAGARPNQ